MSSVTGSVGSMILRTYPLASGSKDLHEDWLIEDAEDVENVEDRDANAQTGTEELDGMIGESYDDDDLPELLDERAVNFDAEADYDANLNSLVRWRLAREPRHSWNFHDFVCEAGHKRRGLRGVLDLGFNLHIVCLINVVTNKRYKRSVSNILCYKRVKIISGVSCRTLG